ncbi:IclR family transcriptional regulator [Frigidibacter mobilis]|uniref:IclR family transcriptional regulator n=1 Tax=Frigidibacter mobilis TaxID=1335048 RepID=A0A165SU08_9RHOB|nr:IclR family transcriptional regulator [Frigidibacter mobilis]AMY71089.1 IclR family transcriptional regulator [Frigidibacter mobilis]
MSILHNAAQVLHLFNAECSDLTVTEASQRLDMPKANASRLLKAMREAGLLEVIGNTRRHRPGKLLLDLAVAYRRSSGLIGRAGEVVAEVTRSFGHTGYVSVLDGREVTAVLDFEGSNSLRVVSNLGRRLQAHQSATGRSLLARLAPDQVAALYAEHPAASDLAAQLEQIRHAGFAYSNQESTPGVEAIGIAVGDPSTQEAVSLCIVYPHTVVDEAARSAIIAALGQGAARIAAQLGDTEFTPPTAIDTGLENKGTAQ